MTCSSVQINLSSFYIANKEDLCCTINTDMRNDTTPARHKDGGVWRIKTDNTINW